MKHMVCHSSRSVKEEPDWRASFKLQLAIALCLLFAIVEIMGGYWSKSLCIFTDAIHLLSDFAGFAVSLLALKLSSRTATAAYSFGYQRVEILGALMSIVFVWTTTLILVMEAIERLQHPEDIDGYIMTIVAAIGLVVNLVLAIILGHDHGGGLGSHHHHHHHGQLDSLTRTDSRDPLNPREEMDLERGLSQRSVHGKENINIRAAFIHAVGDVIQSAGVLLAALIIWMFPSWTAVDPICTFLCSILVIISTVFVTRDACRILMEAVPRHIDVGLLERNLLGISKVIGLHNLRIWSIIDGYNYALVHLEVNETDVNDQSVILQKTHELFRHLAIENSTVQIDLVKR